MKNTDSAFPLSEDTFERGMDLRDYFAAKALQGLLSAEVNGWIETHETYEFYLKDLVTSAYKMADAMMEARDETN